MIRRTFLLSALASTLLPWAAQAATSGTLDVSVSISQQRMTVSQNGQVLHQWPVSTARKGKRTPHGDYRPQWLSKHHRSSRYNNAPMPNAIFYSGHYAIHGTNETQKLGSPASAGCVRLSIENSARLFDHVSRNGLNSMRIRIGD